MTIRRLLFVGYVWPEPRSSAAGSRVLSLIRCFHEAGWTVDFASAAKESEHRRELESSGVGTHLVELNDQGFDGLVRELNPEVVVFDRFVTEEQFGWRVRENAPDALRVLDTEDLHFLRRGRERALKAGVPLERIAACEFELISDDALRELSSIARSDVTLLISSFERELLLRMQGFPLNPKSLLHIPLLYDPPQAPPRGFAERQGLAMIGNFRHPPNTDGVFWFMEAIWPAIRTRLPEAQIHLYGAYPPREIMALNRPDRGINVHGWTPDQFEALSRHRLSVAPLRFGAGQKGKIADSWWTGTPVVTTPIGPEGMIPPEARNATHKSVVAVSPEEFAEKVEKLYLDESAWNEASEQGFAHLRGGFLYKTFAASLIRDLETAASELESRREENLLGRMLWMNQNRATEFFGRWLELKKKA